MRTDTDTPRLWLQLTAVVVLGCCAYGNTLRNQFVWDDSDAIVQNYFIKNWSNLPQLLTHEYFVRSNELSYRPLVTLTYFADYSLWGLTPAGYHLSNVILHIATAILLLWLVRRMTGRGRLGFMAGLLFAVHPVTTEAVNMISFREDIMAGLFMVSSFLLYLRFRDSGGSGRRLAYAGSLACYFAGLLSKEMAATLPALLVIYDLLFSDERSFRKAIGPRLRSYAGYAAVLAVYLLIRFAWMQSPKEHAIAYAGNSLWISLLTTTRIVATYIKLMFLPLGLCAQYVIPPSRSPLDTDVLLSLGLIGLCLWLAWKIRRDSRIESFGIASFFVLLLPVANIIPIVNIAAERYLYVPAGAFCVFLAALLDRRKAPIWLLVVILATFSGITIRRNMDWHDSRTIWSRTGEQVPESADIHHELGDDYGQKGMVKEAIEEYHKALAIAPNNLAVHVNLGVAYDSVGQPDLALEQYRLAVAIDPTVSKVHNNIGNIYYGKGLFEEAVKEYERAIELNPTYPQPYNNCAMALMQLKRFDRAVATMKKALSLEPNDISGQMNLALIYLNRGDEALAREMFGALLARGADMALIQYTLAEYYARNGRLPEAIGAIRKLLNLKPDETQAYLNLGELYERTGDREAAVDAYETFTRNWRGAPAVLEKARGALKRLDENR